MTVMIETFFGLSQRVIRLGLWLKMKPGEKDLYVFLMFESERCCTREMTRTDQEIRDVVGVAARTLCNARKKLQERGLVRCQKVAGNKFRYTLCDAETREPYPGDPKQRIFYQRKGDVNIPRQSLSSIVSDQPRVATNQAQGCGHTNSLEQHGLAGVFDT